MFLIFILFFLLIIAFSGITTIPFAIALLVAAAVLFKESWVFFVAFLLGLFLDLLLLRPLAQTSLFFVFFIFIIWLYERKFETQTLTFVFAATFLGSLIYLKVFGYSNILMQSLVSALIAILFFKLLSQNSKLKSQKYN